MTVTAMKTYKRRNRINGEHPGVDIDHAVETAFETVRSRNEWDLDDLVVAIATSVASAVADDVEKFERELAAAKLAHRPRAQMTQSDIRRIRGEFLDALEKQARSEALRGRDGFYDAEISRAGDWIAELRRSED